MTYWRLVGNKGVCNCKGLDRFVVCREGGNIIQGLLSQAEMGAACRLLN